MYIVSNYYVNNLRVKIHPGLHENKSFFRNAIFSKKIKDFIFSEPTSAHFALIYNIIKYNRAIFLIPVVFGSISKNEWAWFDFFEKWLSAKMAFIFV